MAKNDTKNITIVGAGLAGSYLAILLAKEGFSVSVFDKLSETETINENSNRSYNLTFYKYAAVLLRKEGIWDNLQPHIIKLKGAVTHVAKLKKPIISGFSESTPYYTISRAHLLSEIIKKARKNKLIKFYFNHELKDIDLKKHATTFRDYAAGNEVLVNSTLVVGADGINSKVREIIQKNTEGVVEKIQEPWEYKQVLIDKNAANTLGLQKDRMHAWTNSDSIFSAFPQKDGTFSGMFIVSKKTFSRLKSEQLTKNFIESRHANLGEISSAIYTSIRNNMSGNFNTLHTKPWHFSDFLVLLGDSAHSILPFYGQGMSAAFGDAETFVQIAKNKKYEWEKALKEYEEERKANMDALGDMAREIFADYRRDKRAYYPVIYAKFEQILANLFPQLIIPPPFEKIAEDPGNTATILTQHKKQRKIFGNLGVNIFIKLMTQLISLLKI